MVKDIQLCLIEEDDREQFILDNQEAFNYGALEELGCRNENDKIRMYSFDKIKMYK